MNDYNSIDICTAHIPELCNFTIYHNFQKSIDHPSYVSKDAHAACTVDDIANAYILVPHIIKIELLFKLLALHVKIRLQSKCMWSTIR